MKLIAALIAALAVTASAAAANDPVARKQAAQLKRENVALRAQVKALRADLGRYKDWNNCAVALQSDFNIIVARTLAAITETEPPDLKPLDDGGACQRAGITRVPPVFQSLDYRFDGSFRLLLAAQQAP